MNVGTPIPQYEKAQSIPSGTTYIADMGDGSGTKGVTQEVLTKEVGRGLKIGDTEELQTSNKESIVAAINEAAQSGGGSSVDILDSKEEIEANTESGKAAGAQALKEMFSEIYSNFAYDDNGIYGYHRKVDGADTVIPFTESVSGSYYLANSYAGTTYSQVVIPTLKRRKIVFTMESSNSASGKLIIGDAAYDKSGTYDVSGVENITIRNDHNSLPGATGSYISGTYVLT